MSIEEFKIKLQEDFGVTLEVEEISGEATIKSILHFADVHTAAIKRNLQFYTFNDMAIAANQSAKFSNAIPPFVGEATVYEISDCPYTVQIQALLPVVYFFVQRVLR